MDPLETLKATRKARLKLAFDTLAAAGIRMVTITFDGCGDSGQIESITPDPDIGLPDREIIWVDGRREWKNVQVPTVPGEPLRYDETWKFDPKTGKLQDVLEAIVYDYMEKEHPGWENNDGAYGEFVFHVADRRVDYSHNTRFTDSSLDEYSYTEDEETGEEEIPNVPPVPPRPEFG